MARAGLLKSEVKRARDQLLAQHQHPSADAIRVALGNTGSKTTIHKYLKELEEEGGGANRVPISEPLQELVERLAARLQEEAGIDLATARDEFAEKIEQYEEVLAKARHDAGATAEQLQQAGAALAREQEAHLQAKETLQTEAIARHTAEQQVKDLRDRLAENETHRLSLEEKHQHARDALEHYRSSVKEQREQDQQRHEHQIQQLQSELRLAQQAVIVKQDELTRLNQEGARLVADLSHAQKGLRDEQELGRRQTARIDALQAVEVRCAALDEQLRDREVRMADARDQLTKATATVTDQSAQLQHYQLELAGTAAKLAAQQELVTGLQAALANVLPKKGKLPGAAGE